MSDSHDEQRNAFPETKRNVPTERENAHGIGTCRRSETYRQRPGKRFGDALRYVDRSAPIEGSVTRE